MQTNYKGNCQDRSDEAHDETFIGLNVSNFYLNSFLTVSEKDKTIDYTTSVVYDITFIIDIYHTGKRKLSQDKVYKSCIR